MDESFAAGDLFLLSQGRLLERRLFATCFLGAAGRGVVDALRGYRNDDGGFGHGLEPDKRCPRSLPIDVETALQAMATADAADGPMVDQACDFLARTAAEHDAGGAVPLALPVIESFPRAAHWGAWAYAPALNPTAGLVGLLHRLGVDHPWRAQAEAWCWLQLEDLAPPADAHTLSEILVFLDHVPDRERADAGADRLQGQLADIQGVHLDPETEGYGLSPLHFAPSASSRWRRLFTDAQIEADLDRMQRSQEADGGWPITWDPPSEGARIEWRGIVTLANLRTLVSYGRLSGP
jgi:hypothetical protein